jgi:hypothetical protein
MATSIRVKLCILIMVAAAVAGTGNGELCKFRFYVHTPRKWGAGTDGTVTFGAYDKNGAGWTHSYPGKGKTFDQGNDVIITVADKECMDPCRLTLSIDAARTAGSAWYPDNITVDVSSPGIGEFLGIPIIRDYQHFYVGDWVYDGKPAIERRNGACA